jgi:hypothetical protein
MPSSLRRVWSPDWIPILTGQAVGVLCGLAGVRLLSTWVPPDTLGLYGLCLVLAPAGALLTHHGLARHAARHWPVEGDARDYYGRLVTAARGASLFLVGLLAVVFSVVSKVANLPYAATLPWLCVAALTGAYGAVLHAILQTSRAYWADCAVSCGNSLTRTGGPLLAVLAAGASVPVLLAGFALPQALVLAGAWWWMLGRYRDPSRLTVPASPVATSGDVGRYSRSFWLVGMCTLAGGGLHRVWAAFCLDTHELGYFTLAGNLAFVLPNVLSAALSQFLYPRLFARARLTEATSSTTWLRPVEGTVAAFALVALVGTLALHLIAPRLIGVLIHPDYAGALPYLIANGGYATALALGHFYQLPSIAASRPAAAGRAMLGLVIILALGGGLTASLSPAAYLLWLTLSPLAAGLWLAATTRLDERQ